MLEELLALRAYLVSIEPSPLFMGIPDRWYRDGPEYPYGHPGRGPRFRCARGHVSEMVLKTETRGDRCLAGGCGAPVMMTFPEDVDDPTEVEQRAALLHRLARAVTARAAIEASSTRRQAPTMFDLPAGMAE